jgi:hypothetical protein
VHTLISLECMASSNFKLSSTSCIGS